MPPSVQPGRVPQRFETAPQPKSLPRAGGIQLPSTTAPANAAQVVLKINRFDIRGATVFKPEDFEPITQDVVGKRTSLSDIYAVASRITAQYGQAGYILSRAVVPPQMLKIMTVADL